LPLPGGPVSNSAVAGGDEGGILANQFDGALADRLQGRGDEIALRWQGEIVVSAGPDRRDRARGGCVYAAAEHRDREPLGAKPGNEARDIGLDVDHDEVGAIVAQRG
jgi:hypothetical protein